MVPDAPELYAKSCKSVESGDVWR